ncbi:uncharacterized protein EV420DRAFT_1481614 [Desarmillaria tabescens]|uniref:Uncharacterized protein n=1 Tax=Armillaria tabescens TaxID=1929756 RepID=A0AA39N1Q1_ARMTA|nr:uncharacterized protein EV420DRAFT_1481614 [Desarmillaria tabescens]KAK0454174.1 hypothetical protein EV420DRAFT_1481614 [Desarmillaria tabescens]
MSWSAMMIAVIGYSFAGTVWNEDVWWWWWCCGRWTRYCASPLNVCMTCPATVAISPTTMISTEATIHMFWITISSNIIFGGAHFPIGKHTSRYILPWLNTRRGLHRGHIHLPLVELGVRYISIAVNSTNQWQWLEGMSGALCRRNNENVFMSISA